ncbi:hypothetical protein [Streptomyces hoynatensis]|uniref:Alpha/beta hydrolase n=1 Tax=Streptomyces hoynatensis TaxID=1141874 RepID=A0A3A9ZF16_9ACTN|nr:hypothetical protein [Streptomyces hoynatensis]RKN45837.1 hypothetical protein D7294_05170 [Streptomyces hoynatensis]
MLYPFASAMPGLAALRPLAGKLVPAAGHDSRAQVPRYGPIAALAERLGPEPAEFPGGHVGAAEHPAEFADRLLTVLG